MINVEILKREVIHIAKKNSADLVVLFGSYARGTATGKSDIDLIFVEETGSRYLRRLDKYYDYLVDKLHTAIDIFVYTPEEFIRMKDRFFVKRALTEGIILYESGKVPV